MRSTIVCICSEVSEDEEQNESGPRKNIRKKKRRQSSQPSPAASSTASNVATPKSGRKLKKLKRTDSLHLRLVPKPVSATSIRRMAAGARWS